MAGIEPILEPVRAKSNPLLEGLVSSLGLAEKIQENKVDKKRSAELKTLSSKAEIASIKTLEKATQLAGQTLSKAQTLEELNDTYLELIGNSVEGMDLDDPIQAEAASNFMHKFAARTRSSYASIANRLSKADSSKDLKIRSDSSFKDAQILLNDLIDQSEPSDTLEKDSLNILQGVYNKTRSEQRKILGDEFDSEEFNKGYKEFIGDFLLDRTNIEGGVAGTFFDNFYNVTESGNKKRPAFLTKERPHAHAQNQREEVRRRNSYEMHFNDFDRVTSFIGNKEELSPDDMRLMSKKSDELTKSISQVAFSNPELRPVLVNRLKKSDEKMNELLLRFGSQESFKNTLSEVEGVEKEDVLLMSRNINKKSLGKLTNEELLSESVSNDFTNSQVIQSASQQMKNGLGTHDKAYSERIKTMLRSEDALLSVNQKGVLLLDEVFENNIPLMRVSHNMSPHVAAKLSILVDTLKSYGVNADTPVSSLLENKNVSDRLRKSISDIAGFDSSKMVTGDQALAKKYPIEMIVRPSDFRANISSLLGNAHPTIEEGMTNLAIAAGGPRQARRFLEMISQMKFNGEDIPFFTREYSQITADIFGSVYREISPRKATGFGFGEEGSVVVRDPSNSLRGIETKVADFILDQFIADRNAEYERAGVKTRLSDNHSYILEMITDRSFAVKRIIVSDDGTDFSIEQVDAYNFPNADSSNAQRVNATLDERALMDIKRKKIESDASKARREAQQERFDVLLQRR